MATASRSNVPSTNDDNPVLECTHCVELGYRVAEQALELPDKVS
jgi:hypothetical protein